MARYVLRYGNATSAPEEHVESLRATPGLDVVEASGRMALVDGDKDLLHAKLAELGGGWSVSPMQDVPLPDTRKTIV